MSSEGNKADVFRTTKIRTKLKGDSSWLQPRDESQSKTEEEKPWLAEVRARRLNGAPIDTSPTSSPTNSSPPLLKTDTENKAPTPGYLIRGVFKKYTTPTSTTPSNGLSATRQFTKKPSQTYKAIAPHTVRSAPLDPEDQLSLEEQEKRKEAASSVLKRSAVRQRSYVLSAAKKYENMEASPDPLTVENSPSFVATRVGVTSDDQNGVTPARVSPVPLTSVVPETSAASTPEPEPLKTSDSDVKAGAKLSVTETVTPKVEEIKDETPKNVELPTKTEKETPLPDDIQLDYDSVVIAKCVQVAPSDLQSDDSGISGEPDTSLNDFLLSLKTTVAPPSVLESAASSSTTKEAPVPVPGSALSPIPTTTVVVTSSSQTSVTKPADTKPIPYTQPAPNPTSILEPKIETVLEFKSETKPVPEPEPAIVPVPKPALVLNTEPAPEVKPEPVPVPKPELILVVKAEPGPVVDPQPTPEPKPKPALVAKPEPSLVLNTEPASVVKPEPVQVPTLDPTPVVRTEPVPIPKLEPLRELMPEPTSVIKAEPAPEVKPELVPVPELETAAVVKFEPAPEVKLEPAPELKSEVKSEPAPELKPEVKPEPAPEVKPEPVPLVKLESAPEVKLEPAPELKPAVKPELAPEVKPEPVPMVKLESAPEVKLEPAPELKPAVKPELAPEVKPEPAPVVKPELAPEVKPEPAPVVEPAPAPEVKLELAPEVKPEPAPEVKPELAPEVKPEPAPVVEPAPAPEVKSELKSEPAPEVKPETALEVKSAVKSEPAPEVKPESAPVLEPEVKPEPAPEVKPEFLSVPKPEPALEPKPEPAPLLMPEPSLIPEPEMKPESNLKPEQEPELKLELEVKPEAGLELNPNPDLLSEPKFEPKLEPEPVLELEVEPELEIKPGDEPSKETSPSSDTLTTLANTLISFQTTSSSSQDNQLVPAKDEEDSKEIHGSEERTVEEPTPQVVSGDPLTDDLLGISPAQPEEPSPPSPGRWSQDLLAELSSDPNPVEPLDTLLPSTNDGDAVNMEKSCTQKEREEEKQQTDETAEETQSPPPLRTGSESFDLDKKSTDSEPSESKLTLPTISAITTKEDEEEIEEGNKEDSTNLNALESLAENILPIDTNTTSLSSQVSGETDPPQQTDTEESSQEAEPAEGQAEDQHTLIMFERKSTDSDSPWGKWTLPTVYTITTEDDEEEDEEENKEDSFEDTQTVASTVTIREMQSEPEPAVDRSTTSSTIVVEERRVITPEPEPEPEPKKGFVFVKEYVNATELSLHNPKDEMEGSEYLASTFADLSSSSSSRPDLSSTCTYCGEQVGSSAKITIDHLNINCHPTCFKCEVCSRPMGDLLFNMFIHDGKVHCESCYSDII